MPLFEKYSKPISCQSITKFVVAEENFLTLCLLSWTSSSGAFVCVFDLNQWYKQQLPDTCDWRASPTFLAIFPLGKQPVLDVWMNGVTVTPFSSLNRPEEHFYPSSLSFGIHKCRIHCFTAQLNRNFQTVHCSLQMVRRNFIGSDCRTKLWNI